MNLPIVAFDIDGTLISENTDKPKPEMVRLLQAFYDTGKVHVVVWSGGGVDYARTIGNRIKLPAGVEYMAKTNAIRPDLAFDDMPEFDMADKVIIV